MTKIAVQNRANKQRDYIAFLELVLDECIVFKKELDAGYKNIVFRTFGSSTTGYEIYEGDWVNHLSSCIYDAIKSETYKLQIAETKDSAEWRNLYIPAEYVIDTDFVSTDEISLINAAINKLENKFVEVKLIERLREESRRFSEQRMKIMEKPSVFYLERTEIDDYLNAYYEFLNGCIVYGNIFEKEMEESDIIDKLLLLDTEFNDINKSYYFNFWSPIVLNKFQKVNYGIQLFFDQITRGEARQNEKLQRIYRRTLLTKVQQSFRWYVLGQNHELMHAAIAPFVEQQSHNLFFRIVGRSLKEYNSYEGMNELRLAQKIVYEYQLMKKKDMQRFDVAILGDIYLNPLLNLYEYVKKRIEQIKVEEGVALVPVYFNVYTKNNTSFKKVPESHIKYRGTTGDVLQNKFELENVIENNNIVFLLDCTELYQPLGVVKEDVDFIRQKYFFSGYSDYNNGSQESPDICRNNSLEELYEIMTCRQCFGRFGRVGKIANSALIDFCESKQREIGSKSTIYIYVSDMRAFHNLYYNDQYYIRTERYNQKEVGIIRYSSEEITRLEVGTPDSQMLVFDMWQFIKTISIEEKESFIENTSLDSYMELDSIYIGIDYTNWHEFLTLHYYTKDNKYDEDARKFINEVLLPIFNNHSKDMFNRYIRKAMRSFFYSAAKCVNDMLFIHLFENKEDILGNVTVAKQNAPDRVYRNINIKYKYSSKRFYDMIMRNYDISSDSYMGQIRTAHIIQRNEDRSNKIVKGEIYGNVVKACDNLSYRGYLRENCLREV